MQKLQRNPLRIENPVLNLPIVSSQENAFNARHEQPAFLEYWRVLVRRRWTVVSVIAGFVVLAAVVSFTMRPRYRASSRITVEKEDLNALGFKNTGSGLDEAEYNMYLDAQERILTSDTLVLQTLRAVNLLTADHDSSVDASSWIQSISKPDRAAVLDYQSGLEVTRVPHTPIIEMRFAGPNPQNAAKFVNGLVQVYIEQNFTTRYRSAQQISKWLSKELEELKRKVEASQTNLAQFQKEKGIIGTDDKQNIIMQKLDDLNRELTSAQADRMQKEALYRAGDSGDPELLPGAAESAVINQLKSQQAQVENVYAQATVQMGPAHPKVRELKSQIDEINNSLRVEFAKIASRNHNAYLVAVNRENMLRNALNEQKQNATQLNESAIQYEILKHEAQSNQQLYDSLSQRLKEAGISAGLQSGNVRIVDYAQVPLSPYAPNFPLNLAVGLFLGCIGGSALAFVLERFDNRLRTPHEVECVTALPLMGVVPRVGPGGDEFVNGTRNLLSASAGAATPAIIIQSHPKVELLESYRAMRSSILMSSEGAPQVIMVTSALPSEGKTTTSINCAVVLAQQRARVLLIDADLRAPRIHKVLGLHVTCGLSTLLAEKAEVRDRQAIVQYSRVPNLFVLPAGPSIPEPSQLLDSAVVRQKISEWRKAFTYIVIDTPPVLACSDSLVLSADADCVLLTAVSGRTPKSALLRARDLLLGVNAKIGGVVVNGVDLGSAEFSYYGYYGSGGDSNGSQPSEALPLQ